MEKIGDEFSVGRPWVHYRSIPSEQQANARADKKSPSLGRGKFHLKCDYWGSVKISCDLASQSMISMFCGQAASHSPHSMQLSARAAAGIWLA